MKIRITLLALLIALCLSAAAQDAIKVCKIKIGNCKVFEKENSFDEILILKKGQEVEVIDIAPASGRYLIRVNGAIGYIADQFIYDPELIAMAKERAQKKAEADEAMAAQIKEENWKKLVEQFGYDHARLIYKKQICVGMTSEEVEWSWGTPGDVNRTTTAAGTHEQWVYRGDNYDDKYVYFENGILTTIQD